MIWIRICRGVLEYLYSPCKGVNPLPRSVKLPFTTLANFGVPASGGSVAPALWTPHRAVLGPISRKPQKRFRARKAIAKSRTLRLLRIRLQRLQRRLIQGVYCYDIPRMSLHCNPVPAQYREYENGLLVIQIRILL